MHCYLNIYDSAITKQCQLKLHTQPNTLFETTDTKIAQISVENYNFVKKSAQINRNMNIYYKQLNKHHNHKK